MKRLKKSPFCELCKAPDRKGKGGRSTIHGHHEDHRKALEVIWVCAKCHRKLDKVARGSESGTSKLTENLAKAAILLKKEGFIAKDIADFMCVSRPTISKIVNGKQWLHVSERAKRMKGAE